MYRCAYLSMGTCMCVQVPSVSRDIRPPRSGVTDATDLHRSGSAPSGLGEFKLVFLQGQTKGLRWSRCTPCLDNRVFDLRCSHWMLCSLMFWTLVSCIRIRKVFLSSPLAWGITWGCSIHWRSFWIYPMSVSSVLLSFLPVIFNPHTCLQVRMKKPGGTQQQTSLSRHGLRHLMWVPNLTPLEEQQVSLVVSPDWDDFSLSSFALHFPDG